MSEAYHEYVVTDEDVADEFIHFNTSPLGYLTPAQKAIVVMKLANKPWHLSYGDIEIRTGIVKPYRYYRGGRIVKDRCRKCGLPVEYVEYREKDRDLAGDGYWKHSKWAVGVESHDAEPAFSGGS